MKNPFRRKRKPDLPKVTLTGAGEVEVFGADSATELWQGTYQINGTDVEMRITGSVRVLVDFLEHPDA
jgi:hypothetical protein